MSFKKFFLSLFITLLAVVVVFGGITAARFFTTGNLPESLSWLFDSADGGKMNILLMGLDKDKTRADTIMLASVDPENATIKLLSIPRDTKVEVNGKTIKINATMGYQSREELMITKVKEITGMPIHYYAEVDFSGFIEIIDILGGVDIDVPYAMDYDDPAQDLHIHFSPGMQHLDGQAAHDYVRFRHNNDGTAPGNYALGDPGRIEAQQNFLKELLKQKLKPQYLLKAGELANAVSEYVTTNFTVADGLKYIGMLRKMDAESFETFVLPGGSKTISGASYYIYDPEETKELVLMEFGYPEEEAKKLQTPIPAK